MAVVQIRTNPTGNVLAERVIPDAAFPSIRLAFGGTTNAETASNVLDLVMEAMQERAENADAMQVRVAGDQETAQEEVAARQNYRTNIFPPP